MAKLAHFLSMEEIKEIVEYNKVKEEDFDLEKEIVIGNEALNDLKLMKQLVTGIEDFTEEETANLTEFLNDKQDIVGYEKTDFTLENLNVAIESLTNDLSRITNHYSIVNKKALTFESFTYSEEAFSLPERMKKNFVGFFAKINVFKTGTTKLSEKALRIKKMVEKEEDSEKENIKTAAAKKLGFLKDLRGLDLAEAYLNYFDKNIKSRIKFYDSVTKDIEQWSKFIAFGYSDRNSNFSIDKVVAENSNRKWFPEPGNNSITSKIDKNNRTCFVIAFPKKSIVYSIPKNKENWADEYPSVDKRPTTSILKEGVLSKSTVVPAVSKDRIIKYLERVIDYSNELRSFLTDTEDFIDRVHKAYDRVDKATTEINVDISGKTVKERSEEMKDIFKMFVNAFDYISSDIEWLNDDILYMVEKGVDLCYDHY